MRQRVRRAIPTRFTRRIASAFCEHVFVGDLLRQLWNRDLRHVDAVRADVDGAGYDLVVELRRSWGTSRSSHPASGRRDPDIQLKLAREPSGWVTWLFLDPLPSNVVRT